MQGVGHHVLSQSWSAITPPRHSDNRREKKKRQCKGALHHLTEWTYRTSPKSAGRKSRFTKTTGSRKREAKRAVHTPRGRHKSHPSLFLRKKKTGRFSSEEEEAEKHERARHDTVARYYDDGDREWNPRALKSLVLIPWGGWSLRWPLEAVVDGESTVEVLAGGCCAGSSCGWPS